MIASMLGTARAASSNVSGLSELLRQALTHRSHSTPHNERLEFLGDALDAHRPVIPVAGDVVHRHQPVVRLFGELQHGAKTLADQNDRIKMRLIRSPFIVASAAKFAQGGSANSRKCGSNGNWSDVSGLRTGDVFGRIFHFHD